MAADTSIPSRNVSVTADCRACGQLLPAGRPRRWCSDACRQAGWRRRHQPDTAPEPLPPGRPRRPVTVYQCPDCQQRLVGVQRCDDCATFMLRLGPGGHCPCCDEPVVIDGMRDELVAARAELARRQATAKTTPGHATVATVRPDSRRLDPERKRLHDAARLAAYNAESALARGLAPHYARADDEARTLLREIYHAPADLQIVGDQLHVRVNPLSAPRRTRALAALCADLTATQTTYPGTHLTLAYSVKQL